MAPKSQHAIGHVGGSPSAGRPHYPESGPPPLEALQAALAEVVAAVERAGIDYVLMGGLGSAQLGRPRTTDDIDLFIRPDDAHRTLETLAEAGFTTEEFDSTWLFKAWKYGVLVDVIFRSAGDVYLDDDMLACSEVREHKGTHVRVIAPEDLLVIKAAAAAEAVPRHWYDALAIIARCDLDWDYLVHRARQTPRRVLSLLLYAESVDLPVPREVVEALLTHIYPHVDATGGRAVRAEDPPTPSTDDEPVEYVTEHIRSRLAADARAAELGITVNIHGRRIFLEGVVHNPQHRDAVVAVAREAAPEYEICPDLAVVEPADGAPEEELR
ncbi:MAG: nucleotidyltransferase [Acidimicrobiales bacterium]